MDWRSQFEMFMPHGMCLLWRPELMSLHVISDALIAIAYFTIPFAILGFVRRRMDLERRHVGLAVLFAAFIGLCGLTHVVSVIVLWVPIYIIEGWLKGVTAIVSVATAGWLIALMPQALKLPSVAAMQREIAARRQMYGELREKTNALRETNRLLLMAEELSGAGHWRLDTADNRVFWSDGVCAIHGRPSGYVPTLEEAIDAYHPDDRAAVNEHVDHAIASGKGWAFEARLARHDGTIRQIASHGRIDTGPDDAVIGIFGIFQDITESKRQQQALIDSEETFRKALENAVIGNALVAPDGRWLTVNHALCALVGYPKEDLLQGGITLIQHPEDQWSLQETVAALMSGASGTVGTEQRLRHRDGQDLWVQVCASLVTRGDGTPDYLVVQFQDLTERKRAEIIKDEFVSTVNHELRTPLTSIFGSLRLLGATTAGKLDPKSARLLEVAQISCTQLTRLVNDILDIEKIAAGKMDYSLETIAAGPLIEGIISRHSFMADAYGIRFELKIELPDLAIRVDPSRFSQALVNLLSNAAKYSPSGASVNIVARREGEAAIRISVTDVGPGVPQAFRSKIFGRFAQADNSTTRAAGGSGLGLNITKSLIEAFGGAVSFDSVEGQGATFHFVLPSCSMPPGGASTSPGSGPGTNGQGDNTPQHPFALTDAEGHGTILATSDLDLQAHG